MVLASLVGSAFAAYATHYPHPNWAEQEPAQWWQAVCETTRRLLADAGIDAAAIAAVGFSGMMMGCLPVAADGTPLRSCIIWADQRAQAEADFVAERCGADEVYLRCGHRTSPAYCAPKILWVRNHQPEIYARTAKFLVPKDYIVHKLTGEFATDYSDASGTLLFDLVSRHWHPPFLHAAGTGCGAALHPSPDIVGTVTARPRRRLGWRQARRWSSAAATDRAPASAPASSSRGRPIASSAHRHGSA